MIMRRVHVVFLLQGYLFLRSNALVPSILRRTAFLSASPSSLYNSNNPLDLIENSNVTATATSTTILSEPSNSNSAAAAPPPQFGDVVTLRRPSSPTPQKEDDDPVMDRAAATTDSTAEVAVGVPRRQKNLVVAIASIVLAVLNYAWQYTHPLTPIQLLYTMDKNSAPITVIGGGKPTIVDFWAPWCENCKQMAATLELIEEEYSGKVNFVMVNGDNPDSWPLIEAFGVDAIPHLALVEGDGTVDTALIGPVPKRWIQEDLNVLLENSKLLQMQATETETTTTPRQALPHQMLDVFANRPEQRRVQMQIKE